MPHRHISRDDRVALAALLRSGKKYQDIAVLLGFDPTAIGREVTRNGGKDGYTVRSAQAKADGRRTVANQCHRKLGKDTELTDTVKSLLELEFSPEQICGRMQMEQEAGLLPKECSVTSFATIYAWANPDKELARLLPRKHSKYRRRHGITDREKKRAEVSSKRNIAKRPSEVEAKTRIGDWEGDTVIGKEKLERILTYVERKSGYLLARKTQDGTAPEIRKRSEAAFRNVPAGKKLTCTLDNGVEHAEWEVLEQTTGMTIFFANPYHSWERGANENANGLLRRSFPKGTGFASLSDKVLARKVYLINHRPRKRLGWKTPHEVFFNTAIRTLI